MAFNKNKIKNNYSTDRDNVLKDFYIPTLKEAVSYDRAVGYFSSQVILRYLEGLDGLIKNNGKMRLVIGDSLSEDEYKAVKENNNQAILLKMDSIWDDIIHSNKSELLKHRLDILSWLLNKGYLEIKYAFRRRGLYHKKLGIIQDEEGSIIPFSGSMNETVSAINSNSDNPDGNSEEFSVFPSWQKGIFEALGQEKINDFNSVWNSEEKNTITVSLPSIQYEKIRSIYTGDHSPENPIEKDQASLYDLFFEEEDVEYFDFIKPKIPKKIDGHKYQIRSHQIDALLKWQENNYNGIMALATGSGKTITAIHGVTKTAKDNRIVLIVAVPYKILADQWCDVLEMFNIRAIRCYDSSKNWRSGLKNEIGNFLARLSSDFFAVVVVNATLVTEGFLSLIDQIPKQNRFFIGDECHHHGGENAIAKLPAAKYKIGLSATPWSSAEIEQKERLEGYYGPIVASYTMKEALDDGVLTGYKYLLYPVRMNSEEGGLYEKLTKLIVGLLNKKNRTPVDDQMLTNIVFKRSRLLDSLEDKFVTLDNILKDKPVSKYTLFYCGSGASAISEYGLDNEYEDKGEDKDPERTKSIDRVVKILHSRNWNVSKFTANESPKARIGILNNFKSGSIDAMAAIKVLDEGFDVPMCKEAFITASSRNERQFVQRRGRILRKYPGKKEAIIHDFVIIPDGNDQIYKTLIENELIRVREFYSVANNKIDLYGQVTKIIDDYGLDFDLNKEDENE